MEEKIYIVRNLSLFLLCLSIAQLIVVVVLPDILDDYTKAWLLVVIGGVFSGLIVATILARNDAITTLFINFLSPLVSGLITGITLVIIILKVKNNVGGA